jgi:hypothetical protein
LFDDIATIANPRVRKITQNVLENLLEQGRHTNTTVICCAHVITNYSQTRRLLNEATSVVIFPKAGSNALNVVYLKNYGGFSDNEIDKILHLPSRWVRSIEHFTQHSIYCMRKVAILFKYFIL